MEESKPNDSESTAKKVPVIEKYLWKKSYTLVLLANLCYIVLFYFLMKIFN